jgi:hypothetical protein
MVQVRVIITTSPSSPLSSFESMHSQGYNSKEMNKTYCEKFDAAFARVHKRNRWQKWPESFERTRDEVQSGLRVMGYSCSETRSMSPMTEIEGIESWSSITIHASPDMQATSRPSRWFRKITGGPRCHGTSESM